MTIAKIWKRSIVPVVATMLLVLQPPLANALVIDATTSFDDISPSFGPTSGTFNIVSGGVLTTASYAGSTASTNPLTGPLSDVFDGTGFDGTASATSDAFLIGFDTVINVFNDDSQIEGIINVDDVPGSPVDAFGLPTQFQAGSRHLQAGSNGDFVDPREYEFTVGFRF